MTGNKRPDLVAMNIARRGCKRPDLSARNFKHGLTKTQHAEYRVWCGIRKRCLDPNEPAYINYGGRGVLLCERWHDFANFFADMGPRPFGMMIDRIDNNGHYEPSNCRWSTRTEQNRNTRKNVNLTFDGRTQCIAAWGEELGIRPQTIRDRVIKLGWSAEEALLTPGYRGRGTKRRPMKVST
jgi:hypothetical protein